MTMATRKLSELPEATHPFAGTESIPLVQEGETRQVALANLLGEFAIATWLAPYRVSSDARPSFNRDALNQAVLDAVAQKRPPVVLLPPGRIPLDGPVILRRGIRVNGASAADLPIGTELFLVDGSNSVVIQNEGWPTGERSWECAELAYLRVNGNRAGNPDGGSGIAIRSMGTTSEIRQVVVRNCARYGFEFSGTHDPATLRSCTVEDNGAGGVRLGGDGVMLVQALTGHGGGPLFVVDGGGSPSVTLVGMSATGHEPILRVSEGQPQVAIIGGRTEAPAGGGNIVRIEKGEAGVQILGLHHYGFEWLVNDGSKDSGLAAVGNLSGIALYNSSVRLADDSGAALGLGAAKNQRREPLILVGEGSPASTLEAPNGSLYLRSDGAAGSTLYVREAGNWSVK
jgi:hypothetical protein